MSRSADLGFNLAQRKVDACPRFERRLRIHGPAERIDAVPETETRSCEKLPRGFVVSATLSRVLGDYQSDFGFAFCEGKLCRFAADL
jgi:hypothetical protein